MCDPTISFSMTTNAVQRLFLTKPVRPSFSRLNAAWRDKFRNKWYIKYSYKSKRWLNLKPTVDQAELPDTLPPRVLIVRQSEAQARKPF